MALPKFKENMFIVYNYRRCRKTIYAEAEIL